ncbi:hypothetical protein [Demequina aurantiaca]|uniref:hypothetical protein n=1 Tax=Demequina aurantiaca TaxID=676200 RepID=UPI003D352322
MRTVLTSLLALAVPNRVKPQKFHEPSPVMRPGPEDECVAASTSAEAAAATQAYAPFVMVTSGANSLQGMSHE